MGKGSLSIETMIIIVMCLFVLILSILYVTNMTKPVTDSTISTATLYSECNNWRLFSHDVSFFKKETYPGLFKTYVKASDVSTDPKTPAEPNEEDIAKGAILAKNFCTMAQNDPSAADDEESGSSESTVTADNPSDACIALGFNDGNCNQNCASGYTDQGTGPCKNGKKLCCK
jgi:hypothetical protein